MALPHHRPPCLAALFLSAIFLLSGAALALPRVPEPAENPTTEPKRVLGKILFWDEQLSSDNTVACGTCHRPAEGGADPRSARHPGVDAGTIDDVFGSPGIVSMDSDGRPVEHVVFGRGHQVTGRLSPSNFGALWAEELFWDGSIAGEFHDPLTGSLVIARHGALEAQTLVALSNDAEMMKSDRSWQELTDKLRSAMPLALATQLPPDVEATLEAHADYPALFQAAFGSPEITPVRIAFATASYQRTLVADQTPWDRYQAGDDGALDERELYGWRAFRSLRCASCHEAPLFTNNEFFNIGLRRSEFDPGRAAVTGDSEDAGEMKVPSLRNVGLRARFMHTGQFANLAAAIGFYVTGTPFEDRDGIPGGGNYEFNMGTITEQDLRAFLGNALTDPRVRNEEYPFDRPRLRTERYQQDETPPSAPVSFTAEPGEGTVSLRWSVPMDDTGVVDYVLQRDSSVIALLTNTEFTDARDANAGTTVYRVFARDAAANTSTAAEVSVPALD